MKNPEQLPAKWQHLATWWALNRHRYNLAGIARAVGLSKTAAHTLLTDPTTPQYAATAEKLAALTQELQHSYDPARRLPAPAPLASSL